MLCPPFAHVLRYAAMVFPPRRVAGVKDFGIGIFSPAIVDRYHWQPAKGVQAFAFQAWPARQYRHGLPRPTAVHHCESLQAAPP